MGLFDKKNKDSNANSAQTEKKRGFSLGKTLGGGSSGNNTGNRRKGTTAHVSMPEATSPESASGFAKASKANKKRKAKKPRTKKAKQPKSGIGGGFFAKLKKNKKTPNNPMASTPDVNHLQSKAQGMSGLTSDQNIDLNQTNPHLTDPNPNNHQGNFLHSDSLQSDPMYASQEYASQPLPTADSQDALSPLANKKPAKKSLFGKKGGFSKSKTKAKPKKTTKLGKKQASKKGSASSNVLKIIAAVLVLLLVMAVAALFLIPDAMTGLTGSVSGHTTIKGNNTQAVTSQPAQSQQPNITAPENPSMTTAKPEASEQQAQPPATANDGKQANGNQQQQKPASKDNQPSAPADKQPTPASNNGNNGTGASSAGADVNQPPQDSATPQQPAKPVNEQDSQINSAIQGNTGSSNAGSMSYQDFLNEAGTTIYREE